MAKLAEALLEHYGAEALDGLVRNGSPVSLKRALGERWKYVERLAGYNDKSASARENILEGLLAIVLSPGFGEDEFLDLVELLELAPPPPPRS